MTLPAPAAPDGGTTPAWRVRSWEPWIFWPDGWDWRWLSEDAAVAAVERVRRLWREAGAARRDRLAVDPGQALALAGATLWLQSGAATPQLDGDALELRFDAADSARPGGPGTGERGDARHRRDGPSHRFTWTGAWPHRGEPRIELVGPEETPPVPEAPPSSAWAGVHRRARAAVGGWTPSEAPAVEARERPAVAFAPSVLRSLEGWAWWCALSAAGAALVASCGGEPLTHTVFHGRTHGAVGSPDEVEELVAETLALPARRRRRRVDRLRRLVVLETVAGDPLPGELERRLASVGLAVTVRALGWPESGD